MHQTDFGGALYLLPSSLGIDTFVIVYCIVRNCFFNKNNCLIEEQICMTKEQICMTQTKCYAVTRSITYMQTTMMNKQ